MELGGYCAVRIWQESLYTGHRQTRLRCGYVRQNRVAEKPEPALQADEVAERKGFEPLWGY